MAQTDSSSDAVPLNFKTNTSLLQLCAGGNIPVAWYSKTSEPFEDVFVNDFESFNINLYYSHKIKPTVSIAGGINFISKQFDYINFHAAYLKKYGDSVSINIFLYRHLSIYIGAQYAFVETKKINFSGYLGFGGMYTFKPQEEMNSISFNRLNPSGTYYKGGRHEVGGSFEGLFIATLDLRYNAGRDLFFLASASFVQSQINYKVVETDNVTKTDRDFITKPLQMSNISFSVGVGTFF